MSLMLLAFGELGLGWLGVAGLPIVIHLLHRQRHRVMDWAAMRWLLAAMKKNRRWVRLEQWLLLAVRTLILGLVVLAMSKPAVQQDGGFFSSVGSPRHHVLVLDNSLSMQYGDGELRRWQRAKEIATSILDAARQGDLASVVILGTPTTTLVRKASPNLVSVAEEIESLQAQDGVARIPDAVDPILGVFQDSPVDASNRRVYLITDMQRSTWLGENDAVAPAELARRLQSISEGALTSVIDVSGEESPNLAVVQIEQVDPLAVRGRPTVLRATLANFGSVDRSDVSLELRVDGEVELVDSIDLPAGQQKVVAFSPVFSQAGDRSVEVRLAADALPVDNSGWLVARVREALSVLVIDGQPSGEAFESETDYLATALSPPRNDGTYDFVRVVTKLESELLEGSLDEYDLVVLANVGQLTPNEARAVGQFAHRGGGVLFCLGPLVDLAAYNKVAHSAENGLLPVRLLDVAGSDDPNASPITFQPGDYSHPLIADFRDNEQAGLLTAKIVRYVRVEVPPQSQAEVALAYSSGDPAVVLAPYGRGRVGVVTTSADLEWNAWAVSPSYLPVMQQLAQLLVSGRVQRQTLRVGDPISFPLPEGTFDVDAAVTRPERFGRPEVESAKNELHSGVTCLDYTNTDWSGVYRFAIGSPIGEDWAAAVNPWPIESNLDKIPEEELRSTLPGWDFRMLRQWEPDQPMPSSTASDSGSIHRAILYVVLGLVFLESVLAWRFGRG